VDSTQDIFYNIAIGGSPAIGSDGTVYCASAGSIITWFPPFYLEGGALYAVTPGGTLR
jgi:hypothetical protein